MARALNKFGHQSRSLSGRLRLHAHPSQPRVIRLARNGNPRRPVIPASLPKSPGAPAKGQAHLRIAPSPDSDTLDALVSRAALMFDRLDAMMQPKTLRVTATDKGDLVVFDVHRVTRFYSAGKYTAFMIDGQEYLASESLRALELRLEHASFMRVHRRELVNLASIVRFKRTTDGGCLELDDGQEATVSRTMMQTVRDHLLG